MKQKMKEEGTAVADPGVNQFSSDEDEIDYEDDREEPRAKT